MQLSFALGSLLAAVPAAAQFGGHTGDVVLYVLSHRGPAAFQVAAPGTRNASDAAARFKVTNAAALPSEPTVPNFPRTAKTLFRENDDIFQLVTQAEKVVSPREEFLGKAKEFTLKGILRDDNPGGRGKLDLQAGAFIGLDGGIAAGPNLALAEVSLLLWRPDATTPPYRQVPLEYVGPRVPPGLTGAEYLVFFSKLPLFVLWGEMRKKYPGAGWPAGVDFRLIEEDASLQSTVQVIRIRAGRRTPPFRIGARTHVFVLQGSVDIAPVDGNPTHMETNWHAYLPAGFNVVLSNPAAFGGGPR